VLKAKMGELGAVKDLAQEIRQQLRPLIEVTAPPFDYVEGRYDRSVSEHLEGVADRLVDSLAGVDSVFVEIPERFDSADEVLGPSTDDLVKFFATLRDAAITAVPIVRPGSTAARQAAIAELQLGQSAIRATLDTLAPEKPADLTQLNRLVSRVLADGSPVTLIVDLRSVGESAHIGASQWRHLINGTLRDLSRAEEFRNVSIVASSFPRDLRDVTPGIDASLPRTEWRIWDSLVSSQNRGFPFMYGDYPISHPELNEIDPRQMRMSANIRYTAEDHWVLVKGRNVRDYGYGQFRELAKVLVERPEYSGRDFSWGDGFIWDCAHGDTGTGNATTWRKVGTNHHLTLVARQLSTLTGTATSS
jgi:hypothetical protein